MKYYAWNAEKNERLKRERRISFEEVVFHIGAGDVVDIFEHPNKQRYPSQKITVVVVEDDAYLVPFVESKVEIFLKTIIHSRAATKQYIGDFDG